MEVWDVASAAIADRWPEIVVAGLFGLAGRSFARLRTRMRLGRRIASELVETQRALRDRAFPAGGWREQDPREVWMLEPYVRRVDFLQGLAEAEDLSTDAVEAVATYQHRMEAFIAAWAGAKRRGDIFQSAYGQTVDALGDALAALHRQRRYSRALAGLGRALEGRETPA
jgi:hypothetical protein